LINLSSFLFQLLEHLLIMKIVSLGKRVHGCATRRYNRFHVTAHFFFLFACELWSNDCYLVYVHWIEETIQTMWTPFNELSIEFTSFRSLLQCISSSMFSGLTFVLRSDLEIRAQRRDKRYNRIMSWDLEDKGCVYHLLVRDQMIDLTALFSSSSLFSSSAREDETVFKEEESWKKWS